jgi:hypothetical protein
MRKILVFYSYTFLNLKALGLCQIIAAGRWHYCGLPVSPVSRKAKVLVLLDDRHGTKTTYKASRTAAVCAIVRRA